MIDTLIVAVVAISAFWVYMDATKNNIGKIPNAKGVYNMSAGAWGTVTLLLWIIAFPAYLIKRSNLIEKAKENPATVKGRGGKAAVFGVIGGLWVFVTLGSAVLSALPDCDDSRAEALVGQIINDLPLVKAGGVQFVSLKNIAEQGYNKQTEIRSCKGTLITTAGEDNLQYNIKWSNQMAGQFSVEAQIL